MLHLSIELGKEKDMVKGFKSNFSVTFIRQM